jgi:uncharacterized membrane protein YhhN
MQPVTSVAWFLVAAAAASAVAHLYAEYRGYLRLVYVTKPLTTALLVVVALAANTPEQVYQRAIILGLVLSLFGDVFLMLPRDHFVAGLVSFLAAHVAYTVAFASGVSFVREPLLLLPYLFLAIGVLLVLWPRLGRLRFPVVLYVAALVLMAWTAAARASYIGSVFTVFAAIGGALFVISDATLAINRFRRKFHAAEAVVMSTYVAAQALIALSVWRRAG